MFVCLIRCLLLLVLINVTNLPILSSLRTSSKKKETPKKDNRRSQSKPWGLAVFGSYPWRSREDLLLCWCTYLRPVGINSVSLYRKVRRFIRIIIDKLANSSPFFSHSLRKIDDWHIQLGITRRDSYSYTTQIFRVKAVVSHPQYNTIIAHDNDIALFQVSCFSFLSKIFHSNYSTAGKSSHVP